MALVNGPLFSLEARGAIGKAIVYAKWKGRDYVRKYVIPANPRSLAQQFQRGILETIANRWQYINATNQATWTTLANAHNYSEFNAYCKFNLDGETDGDLPVSTPNGTGVPLSASVNTTTVIPGVNKLDISVSIDDDPNEEDILIVTLGIDGGSQASAQTINRVVHGRGGLVTAGVYEMDMLHVPAGTYHVSSTIIGGDGIMSGWNDPGGPFTVTGV